MAATSRIFVRNLPPSLTEPEFRSHFSTTSSITDSRLIPHRRIGYVGYKTPDAAANAVRYFNKSFIRMSRIAVELAKGIDERQTTGRRKDFVTDDASQKLEERPTKKPKIYQQDDENPKLQEFLATMQPTQRKRTWADGSTAVDKVVAVRKVDGLGEEIESDEDYEDVPKKSSKLIQPDIDHETRKKHNVGDTSIQTDENNEGVKLSEEEPAVAEAPKSDADWLRSRTSRLLGLMNDDELDARIRISPNQSGVELSQSSRVENGELNENPRPQEEDAATKEDPLGTESTNTPKTDKDSSEIRRLFVRNLSYDTSQDEIYDYFSRYGAMEEVYIPKDSRTGTSKGFAYVQYSESEAASKAVTELDGKAFQGRLLHIMLAAPKRENAIDEFALSKLPHKKQQQIRKKQEASSTTFRWNALYMNPDAVMSSIADRLQISKSELLDPTSSSAAVKQAHAETNIIQETKAYLSANGVNFDAFKRKEFSDTVILVKNFPYGTTAAEIKQQFETYGRLTKMLMPPAGTIAIVEFDVPGQARTAFRSLAYRKFKDSVLFLEKAPKAIFEGTPQILSTDKKSIEDSKISTGDLLEETTDTDVTTSSTLYVRNLNFATTSLELHRLFTPLNGFKSARVKTKTDPKRPGQILSMGFGFVEFFSKEDAQSARAALDGYNLDGHNLVIKESHKALDAAEERRKEDLAKKIAGRRTKIIIKNLPFESTRKDVQQLFGPYGKLRSVRVPKKFDSSTRGFAFADFVTAKEAENAMEALSGTHLLGRRLNLDFAAEDLIDPEDEIEQMSKKAGLQADKIAVRQLTAGGRKKFSVNREVDADDVMG